MMFLRPFHGVPGGLRGVSGVVEMFFVIPVPFQGVSGESFRTFQMLRGRFREAQGFPYFPFPLEFGSGLGVMSA